MDKLELNISKLKDNIKKQQLKIQSIKYKMDNETNDYIFETLSKSFEISKTELSKLKKDLDNEVDTLKKEKNIYKKSLAKVKESLNDLYKVSKNDFKIKRYIQEMNNTIINIEKYLS